LVGPAVPASIRSDHAVSVRGEEKHLIFERIGRQWPAVAEHDGLAHAPVLEVDRRAVLGRESVRCRFRAGVEVVGMRRIPARSDRKTKHGRSAQTTRPHQDRAA
jgi:hypothetical protein